MNGYFKNCLQATKNEFNRLWNSKTCVGASKLAAEKQEIMYQLYVAMKNKEITKTEYNYFVSEFLKYDFGK